MRKNNKNRCLGRKKNKSKSPRGKVKNTKKARESKDFNEFLSMSNMLFQSNSFTFQSLIEEFNLNELLEGYCKTELLKFFSGLCFNRKLQANLVVLESIIHSLLILNTGHKLLNREIVNSLFDKLQSSHVGAMCDPSEDVMVGLINTSLGSFKVLEGLWESGSFYCQIFVDIVEKMPDSEPFSSLKRSVYSLLKISDYMVSKAGLQIFEIGSRDPIDDLSVLVIPNVEDISNSSIIRSLDLDALGVNRCDIEYHILGSSDFDKIRDGRFGNSLLERKPIIELQDESLLLALPTSVTTAVRSLILEWLEDNKLLERFQNFFNSAWIYQFSQELKILGQLKNAPFSALRNEIGTIVGAQCVVGVDDRRILQIILVFDDFKDHSFGFTHCRSLIDESSFISDSIKKAQSLRNSNKHFSRGLSLIVGCGWGRTMLYDVGDNQAPACWDIETVSGPDLVTLSKVSNMSLSNFWSLMNAQRKATESGVVTQNINGLLNLYSWVKRNNGNIVPHDNLPPEFSEATNFFMMIDQNELIEVRWETKIDEFRHKVKAPNDAVIEVRRINTGSYFIEDRFRPIFASVDHLHEEKLLALVEGEFARWWLEPTTYNEHVRDLTYRLWAAISGWLLKIDEAMMQTVLKSSYTTIHISYDFLDTDIPSTFEKVPSLKQLKGMTSVHSEIVGANLNIHISFQKGYLAGFYRHENYAEANIVDVIIDAIVDSDSYLENLSKDELFKLVVRNDFGKILHLYSAKSYSDFVKNSLPSPLIRDEIEHAALKFGLGWFDKYSGMSFLIKGKKDCTEYLRGLTWSLWLQIKSSLSEFNKKELINYLLLHHEAAEVDSNHWQITYPAILGIHKEIEQVKRVVLDRISSNNATLSGIRILIEMAICESSINATLPPNKIDIQNLIICANALFQFGNLSDAIHFEMVEPVIKITGLGDVQYDHSFYDSVVMPYGGEVQTKLIEKSAKRFSRLFDDKNEKGNQDVDSNFEKAWFAEYGLSINSIFSILEHFENIGLEKNSAVFEISRDELVKSTLHSKISEEELLKFIDSFSLFERSSWENVPSGFKVGDISPWRFKRRLSVVAKPLISIRDGFQISPSIINKGLIYLIANSYDGTLDGSFFSSKQMKIWIGEQRHKSGHAFNVEAKSRFESIGMQALSDIKVSEILREKTDVNYGDVDVLAWEPDSKTVFLVECKDLEFAKTQGEIAKQVYEFRGEARSDGSHDRLKKHLERCYVLRNNLRKLEAYLKIDKVEKLYVIILFKQIVPIACTDETETFDVKTIFLDRLEYEVSKILG